MRQSAITQYRTCPYKYKLQYVDKVKTILAYEPNNALILGTAIHLGCETGSIEKMTKYYYSQYPIIMDLHINEVIKLEYLLPQVLDFIKQFNKVEHEVPFKIGTFHGTADLLVHNEDGTVDLYDYKYSNNIDNYMESPQLHIYKYFLEQIGYKVNRIAFIFIPKTWIRQKKDKSIYQFRKRLRETLKTMEIQIKYLEYDQNKVTASLITAVEMLESREFPKNPSGFCDWCEYKKYCLEGEDYMILPENKRREKKIDTSPDMWIYADSYVGKSTFIDKFDNLLFLNTDGNTDNTTSPVISIKDEIVQVTKRTTERKFAWQQFLDVVGELEKKENSFKRICIDLVEDLYEHCRLYTYDKLGIEHEQDAGFGKGWDMVRTEYLSTIKRLKNLGYQIIYISKENLSEITLKNGSKITTIRPNINDKVANILAGTVDLTVRAYMDGEDRILQLEKKENIFGGGRFNFKVKEIPLDKDEFIKALEEAQEGIKTYSKIDKQEEPIERASERSRKPKEDVPEEEPTQMEESLAEEKLEIPEDLSLLTLDELRKLAEDLGIDTTDMKRKKVLIDAIENLEVDEEVESEESNTEEAPEEEQPKRRRRRK
ncbi:AAA family ATPase [Tissierellaceae bacterium HCP3S3_D8]